MVAKRDVAEVMRGVISGDVTESHANGQVGQVSTPRSSQKSPIWSYRSGHHLAAEPGTPVSNLFVELLQRVGMETERFADSTAPLDLRA